MSPSTASDPWPPAHCPPLAWPTLANQNERFAWYRAVIEAYAQLWEEHVTQTRMAPVGEKDLTDLENRLGCALPPALRAYHQTLGALSLAETLCSVAESDTPIQPLLEAFPAIEDIAENEDQLSLAHELIVFSDYLGNGNMFCFHRKTGEVYYFDHDGGAMLTCFFPSPQNYLDALMIRCLAEIHQETANEASEESILAQRFGQQLVRKWLY